MTQPQEQDLAPEEAQPFVDFVRMVGRGPGRSRNLTREEARAAMGMIMDGTAAPLQVGAFLIVMRYRKENADELAGFVDAARDRMVGRVDAKPPALDWPSYADRHKQLPWFVLSALLLAENGVRLLMHGLAGMEDGCVTTPAALASLGVAPSPSLSDAAARIEAETFAYVPVAALCPGIEDLFALRPLLGLRTPANTFARMLNPLDAPAQIQGVFHPGYLATHLEAALALGQSDLAVFKGGGGEGQCNPAKDCAISVLRDGAAGEEAWPALAPSLRFRGRDEPAEVARIPALWRGTLDAPGPEAAVIATAAVALSLVGRATEPREAQALAKDMWHARPKSKF